MDVAPLWMPAGASERELRERRAQRTSVIDVTAPAPFDPAVDDGALVAATLEGRRDAFDLLVERHRRKVYGVCYRFTGNHEDAVTCCRTSSCARTAAWPASGSAPRLRPGFTASP